MKEWIISFLVAAMIIIGLDGFIGLIVYTIKENSPEISRCILQLLFLGTIIIRIITEKR